MTTAAGSGFQEYLEQTRDEPVYVILGVQGAGTNLLGRLLVRIFGFSLMRDQSLVFNAAARLGSHPSRRAVAREIRTIKANLFPSAMRRAMSKYALRENDPFAGFERELNPSAIGSGADLARLVYAYRAYALGTTRMAIKSDDIWEHIEAIDQVVPNRRTILITRDFRDNLVSITGKSFGPVEPLKAALYVKERLSRYAVEYRRHPAQAYHARFSTLVNSPRQFVDDFARHFQLTPTVDPNAVIEAYPFRQGKIDKWRGLPADQLAWCEGILYDELEEFGYPPISATRSLPGASALLAATARDGFKRVPQKLRTWANRLKADVPAIFHQQP